MKSLQIFNRLVPGLMMLLASSSIVHAGVVTIWGGEIKGGIKKIINDFYNNLAGHSSSIATGELDTANLATTNLLWITSPYKDFTTAELNTMAGFIAAGNRIVFTGEHGSAAPDQNARINTALSFLGCAIRINYNAGVDDNIRSASVTDGQILIHPLTAGVSTYEYGWFAPLTISGAAQALMMGEEPYNGNPSVMMAYQNIGAGSVFVVADQSMWEHASTSWPGGFDNARFFENLLIGSTAMNAPTTNPVFITTHSSTLTIYWTYSDAEGDIQQKYEVEVWTGPLGTGTRIWDPPVGTGTNPSVVYAGSPLAPSVAYYARVRASDVYSWGNFAECSFTLHDSLIAHPLLPVVTENGYIHLSLDALGTAGVSGGTIQVNKPKNAAVRIAYCVGASVPGRELNDRDVSIDGSGVVWLRSILSSINSLNCLANVTSLVKPKIDASAAGLVDLPVVEKEPDAIDGVILAVIFDDPNQTTRNTVILFFGAQNVAGDDFYIRYSEPINRSAPNLRLDFSLGISYSNQRNKQYSIIDINGKKLTSAAGGEDDGFAGTGGLITVGGIGDLNNNPVDPNSIPDSCRDDDELYNLIPFVSQGDTQTHIYSQNPSNDDNICFAALFSSITSIVGEGILLAPVVDTNFTGTTDTLIATIQNDLGKPVIGRKALFEILSGPHAGFKDTSVTNSSGKALFRYTGASGGLDEIVATMTDTSGALKASNHAYHYWKTSSQNKTPVIKHAACFADSGRGSVNRVEIRYNRALDTTEVPDSIRICWPDSSDCRMVRKTDMTLDQSDSAHLTITIPSPAFPEEITRYTGDNGRLGRAYWKDPLEPNAQTVQSPFAIADSVGPLIMSAAVVERIKKGIDTIYVSFSEDIEPQSIIGQSLILIKNGVPSVIVVDAFQQVSGGFYVVSLDSGCPRPLPGDSLRINPEGPLRDRPGNPAHALNRPALLGTKGIPPSMLSAYYFDRDSGRADGIVDESIIKFDRKAQIDGLSLLFDWGGNIPHSTIQGPGIAYASADSTAVSVILGSAFPTRPFPKTSGVMYVTSQWKQWKKVPWQTDNAKVQDSAGPVISSASYLLSGEIGGACDTLVVFFSEPMTITPDQNAVPFKFINGSDNSTYALTVTLIKEQSNDTMARFCVNSDPMIAMPNTGDSIWINPAGGVSDTDGIAQLNERNRRVAFKVSRPNAELYPELCVKALPNPFMPGTSTPKTGSSGAVIGVSTVNPAAKLPEMTGSVRVFDLLGNLVFEGNLVKRTLVPPLNTCYCAIWEGYNRKNRMVSTGVYPIVIKYAVAGEAPVEKRMRIGVKR